MENPHKCACIADWFEDDFLARGAPRTRTRPRLHKPRSKKLPSMAVRISSEPAPEEFDQLSEGGGLLVVEFDLIFDLDDPRADTCTAPDVVTLQVSKIALSGLKGPTNVNESRRNPVRSRYSGESEREMEGARRIPAEPGRSEVEGFPYRPDGIHQLIHVRTCSGILPCAE